VEAAHVVLFSSMLKLLMYLTNKPLKVKQINSIEIWTDAFINNANVMIDRHHLLAGYSLLYMSIIRGAVVDAIYSNLELDYSIMEGEHIVNMY
jgi:hypothetical protein